MNLQKKLAEMQHHYDALKSVIEEFSGYVITTKSPSIEIIQRTVCEMRRVPLIAMQHKSRKAEFVEARFIAFYLAKELTSLGVVQIADNFRAGLDHGAVLHGIKRIRGRMDTEITLAENVALIASECRRRLNAHEMPLFAVKHKRKGKPKP